MKKIALIILFFISKSIFSQPVLTQSNLVPSVGDVYVLYETDTSPQPGTPGANITWTFNNLSFTPSQTTNYIDIASSPYPNAFPTASYVEKINNQYNYYSVLSGNLECLGNVSGGDTLRWNPPMSVMCYPLTYLTSCPNSLYTGTLLGDSISGSFSVSCDGYGTLIINGQMFANCLRVRGERHETIFSSISGQSHSDQVVYYWVDDTHKFPLLNIATANLSGAVSYYLKKVLVSSFITGIKDFETQQLNVAIYPNPTDGFVFLDFQNYMGSDLLIRVSDLNGSKILENRIENNNGLSTLKLDLNNIVPGIYILEIFGIGSHTIKKLVIH